METRKELSMQWLSRILLVVLMAVFGLLALTYCTVAKGQVTLGKPNVISGTVPFCFTKASLIAVAMADAGQGIPAAKALLDSTDDCDYMGQISVIPLSVVFSVKAERGTVRVVEVVYEVEGRKRKVYVLTDTDIIGLQDS